MDLAIWVFVAVNILTAFTGQDWRQSILGVYLQPFHGIITLLICVCLYYGMKRQPLRSALFKSIWIMSYPMTLYAVAQKLGYDFMKYDLPQGRATSFAGNPVYFGACLAVMAPICFEGALNGSRIALVACLSIGVGLAVANAKGAILAAVLGVLVLGLNDRFKPTSN